MSSRPTLVTLPMWVDGSGRGGRQCLPWAFEELQRSIANLGDAGELRRGAHSEVLSLGRFPVHPCMALPTGRCRLTAAGGSLELILGTESADRPCAQPKLASVPCNSVLQSDLVIQI